ncbi:MAG: hypothetical protein M3135_03395 [Actinomycetota bacterium]|nr:hypothetical protein [Actinomycetota bacterium]
MHRLLMSSAAAVLVAVGLGPPSVAAPERSKLSFSITEARAYVFRAPLRKEVIEAAALRDRLDPCNPEEDPYGCDDTQYNHEPNCPPPNAYGAEGPVPPAEASPGTPERSGGAGGRSGNEEEPADSTPVALNDLVTFGTLRAGTSADARGFASDSYVDLSGRQEPEAHTESDAFSENRSEYEERCWPKEGDNPAPSHVHVLSRSTDAPATYHLAQCVERGCTFGGPFAGGAERGETIVDLARDGDAVVGRIRALLEDVTYGNGAFVAETIETLITFRSDGTAGGLEWTVATNVAGARGGGQSLPHPPGQLVGAGPVQGGVAAPYVRAAEDGTQLDIVAPGLVVAHPEQSVFLGGAEVHATFGRSSPTGTPLDVDGEEVPPATGEGSDGGGTITTGTGSSVGSSGPSDGAPPEAGAPVVPAASTEEPVSTVLVRTGAPALTLIVGFGAVSLLLALSRWIGRFGWGRAVLGVQPFRGLDWLYRAFVKP